MKSCTIEGCGNPHYGRGWCAKHYARWRAHGDPEGKAPSKPKAPGKPCAHPGCNKVGRVTKGYCPTHYMRLLRHGHTEDVERQAVAHLHSKHPMYGAWQQMILRCHDPRNDSYGRYGAVGIRVCDRWRSDFQAFLADMGERPSGMTLDRKDPTGNYEPDNCRWATAKTQRNNISEAGDRRARKALSEAKKEYWRRWRAARGLPLDPPTRAEYKARRKAENKRP